MGYEKHKRQQYACHTSSPTTVQSCDKAHSVRDPETEATTEEAALFASIQNSPASLLHADQCKSRLSEGVMSSGDHPSQQT